MRLEKRPKAGANGLTFPRGHNVGVVPMLRLERNWRSLMRMIALCADVEVVQEDEVAAHEAAGAREGAMVVA